MQPMLIHFYFRIPALQLIDDIADVLWKSFQTKIRSDEFVSADNIPIPPGWSQQLAIDCEHLAYMLSIAFFNHSTFPLCIIFLFIYSTFTVKLPWKISDYTKAMPPRPSGFHGPAEDGFANAFPPLFQKPFPIVSAPSSIVDSDSIIAAWYLPDGLTASRQVGNFPPGSN